MLENHPAAVLNQTLASFKLGATCIKVRHVRNITLYDLTLSPGTKIKQLQNYATELALALRAKTKLFFHSLPNQGIVRMEAVTADAPHLNLFPKLFQTPRPSSGDLPFYLGSSSDGEDIWIDFCRNPHMLIGGATGSGKSTLLHTILANALFFKDLQIEIFDTKNIEYTRYPEIFPQVKLFCDFETISLRLHKLYREMERRYLFLRNNSGPVSKYFPYILVIIDEFADLVLHDENKQFYKLLCLLAQKSRAAGIHFVLATQRPSVDIIRGSIKANFPARIACQTSSAVDSRVILDNNGAELLAGNGDAIIRAGNHIFTRFQVAYTTPTEIQNYASN